MPQFVASVAHRDTGKDEYLIREAATERELRDALSDEGLIVRSLRPAEFGGKGARFEIRTPKGRVAGPFGPDILRAMVRDGHLTPHCSIRKTGDLATHAWLPAWKAKGLFPGHVVDSIRRSHEVADGDDDETAKLKALKRLLDDGVIDEQDYKFRKGELLGTPYTIDDADAMPERPDPQPVASTAFRQETPRQFDKATADDRSSTKAPAIALAALLLCIATVPGVWVGAAKETSSKSTDAVDSRTEVLPAQADTISDLATSTPNEPVTPPALSSTESEQERLVARFNTFVSYLRRAVEVTDETINAGLKTKDVPFPMSTLDADHQYHLVYKSSDIVKTNSLSSPIIGEISFAASAVSRSRSTDFVWDRNYLFILRVKPGASDGKWDFVSRIIRPLPGRSSSTYSGDTSSFMANDTVYFDGIMAASLDVIARTIRDEGSGG